MYETDRRSFLKALGAGAAAIALPGWLQTAMAAGAAEKDRPNIILAMTDDQGWADVGYNSDANRNRANVKTPVMDRMAAAGGRRTRATPP